MSPKFTKRHYKMLAEVLRDTHCPICHSKARNIQWEFIRDVLADRLALDNCHFDRAKFLKACNP